MRIFCFSQRLEAILKAEEQREALGVYDSSSSEDEEEREIRIKAELWVLVFSVYENKITFTLVFF